MKNLLSLSLMFVIGCSGADFGVAPVGETDNSDAEEVGQKDTGVLPSEVSVETSTTDSLVESSTDSSSEVDTKEIDICASKYSIAKTGDWICADLVGNAKWMYVVYEATQNYMGCGDYPCTSYDTPTNCVDYFKKYSSPVHKCSCTDNVCTTINVLFRADYPAGKSKATCDDIQLNLGGSSKCTFT